MTETDSVGPAGARQDAAIPVAPAPEPPRKSRVGAFFLGAFSGCLIVFLGVAMLGIAVAAVKDDGGELSLSSEKVAIIPIEGEILESRETIEAIHKYADNDSVKAVVLRINSPGGAIAPSQEIYSEVLKTKKRSGKPFLASCDSVAASGGYYIASACDRIVANPGSVTGSIGVILEWVDAAELVKWAKLKPEMITSGALKATGSPMKSLTDQERAYLQRIVSQLHLQFVKAVAAGRAGKITEPEVAALADGRVFTGEEALSLKLVDELGNLDDAISSAAKLAKISGEPGRIYPKKHRSTILDLLSDSSDADTLLQRVVRGRGARFLYRWF